MSQFPFKPVLSSHDAISVQHLGAQCGEPVFYLYGDVLEELRFHASQRSGFGLLCGCGYLYPVDKQPANAQDNDAPDYVEISAFRDIYPVDDALDYAGYLRRIREFRNVQGDVFGFVCLTPEPRTMTYEDLLLFRTYFDAPENLFVMVAGNGAPPTFWGLHAASAMPEPRGVELIQAVEDGEKTQNSTENLSDNPPEIKEDEGGAT